MLRNWPRLRAEITPDYQQSRGYRLGQIFSLREVFWYPAATEWVPERIYEM
jgi:hypothetical protein